MKKNLLKKLAISAGLAAGVVAMAQQGPPPGGPGQGGHGQGGPGGFHGGFHGGPGGPGGPGMRAPRPMAGPMLLMIPQVQKELRLTEDQIERIREAFHLPNYMGPMDGPPPHGPGGQGGPGGQRGPGGPGRGPGGQGGPGGHGGPGGFGPGGPGMHGGPGMPSQPGGPGQFEKHREEMESKLKGILNERQYARYQQISLQLQGPGAVLRPDVAKTLNLSEDQREEIHGILEKNRPQPPMGPGGQGGPRRQGGPGEPGGPGGDFGGGQGGPGGRRGQGGPGGPGGPGGFGGPGGPGFPGGAPPRPEEMEARRKKVNEAILSVLTNGQRDKWREMLGKPFEVKRPEPPRGE